MSAREQRTSAELTAETERRVREFFEPQLRTLGLSVEQIEEQGLAQLEASLEVLNDAIANPDSFGKIRLSFAAGTGPIIVRSLSEAHIELGILPILLERKALILNRIRGGAVSFNAAPGSALMQDKFAVLHVEIDGGWSVDDIIKLLTQLEQAYLAAAALESLAEPWSLGVSVSATRPREPT